MTNPTPTPTTTTADGLRALADWIESHPDLAREVQIEAKAYGEDSRDRVREWARAMGNAEKVYSDSLFKLDKDFGGDVTLRAVFWRATVCRKVVVGVEKIPARMVPAQRIEAEEREIVEWVCDDPILAVTP